MTMNEFDIIKKYFQNHTLKRPDVIVGSGDDCAVLKVPPDHELVVSIDTMVEGTHFFPDVPADLLAHKILAVNLSDCAAMGAEPAWVTGAMTLPKVDEQWLALFSHSLFDMADQYGVQIVGGDLTHGQILTISFQIHGFVPKGQALTRSGAKVGDGVYVTGTLGDAALGLDLLREDKDNTDSAVTQFLTPIPRVNIGLALRGVANSCIDISDGLLGDLNHILHASKAGAKIAWTKIPLSPVLKTLSEPRAQQFSLTGGEDYELCFTAHEDQHQMIVEIAEKHAIAITRIGEVVAEKSLVVLDIDGQEIEIQQRGFVHF